MKKTRIYTIFFGKIKGREGWPYADFDCMSRKEQLISKLMDEMQNIEFVGGNLIRYRYNEQIREIREKIKDVDGVLL